MKSEIAFISRQKNVKSELRLMIACLARNTVKLNLSKHPQGSFQVTDGFKFIRTVRRHPQSVLGRDDWNRYSTNDDHVREGSSYAVNENGNFF